MIDVKDLGRRLANTLEAEMTPLPMGHPDPVGWGLLAGGVMWVFPDSSALSGTGSCCLPLSDIFPGEVPSDVSLVRLVLPALPNDAGDRLRLGFGYEAVSARSALVGLLDLPSTFLESQHLLVEEALRPTRDLAGGPIRMGLHEERRRPSDAPLPDGSDAAKCLAQWSRGRCDLIFVEAEAGKGKTILLATVAQGLSASDVDRLPLYVPLRRLPLEAGVGWANVAQLVGVVDAGAERLLRAVRNGLVVPLLDGIDEVAGRYDRKLVKDLLSLLTEKLKESESVVIVSGRRTEARQLEYPRWKIVGIALPEPEDHEFRRYVRNVVDRLVREWDDHIVAMPEQFRDLFGENGIDDLVRREIDTICDWIVGVFPAVGKDRTLFFVQGLAAIGIGRRAGNRQPLSFGSRKQLFVPRVDEVCRAAALFSCLRERGKIDQLAWLRYAADRQMVLMQGFSLLASATDRTNLPTPNELAAEAFRIDPVNENEVYVAVTRQNAKHALLYANEAAGTYRPRFLSDWVRCSFLAQSLSEPTGIPKLTSAEVVGLVAGAERARLAFSSILPAMLGEDPVEKGWLDALKEAIAQGSTQASGNQWQLRAAVGDERMGVGIDQPLALAEIDGAEFVGTVIDGELSGDSFILDDSEFDVCEISHVTLSSVSLAGVTFSGCDLTDVRLVGCDGPILFQDCDLTRCRFEDMLSAGVPALHFVDCRFRGSGTLIRQDHPAFGHDNPSPVARFEGCTTEVPLEQMFSGFWTFLSGRTEGISLDRQPAAKPWVDCLKQTLRPFFPVRMGVAGTIQARDYIRLSALGRGRMPVGAPGQPQLKAMLETFGFAPGGRSDHLYAPWSGVLGGGEAERRVRGELIEFMANSTREGPTVRKMLDKIQGSMKN
jgi:hypothetical protein